jgi:hypothetical protein
MAYTAVSCGVSELCVILPYMVSNIITNGVMHIMRFLYYSNTNFDFLATLADSIEKKIPHSARS